MPDDLTVLKLKLSVGIVLVPFMKILLSLLLLSLPVKQFLREVNCIMILFAQNGVSLSNMLQFSSQMFYVHRFWAMILYAHFIVVVGAALCSFYRSFDMIVYGDRLRWTEPVAEEVDINLIISCMSLVFYVLPIVMVDRITYAALLVFIQIGVEIAVYRQFNTLVAIFNSPEVLILRDLDEGNNPPFDDHGIDNILRAPLFPPAQFERMR